MCQRLEAVEYIIFELYTVNLHLCYFELQWSLKSSMCRPVDLSTAPGGRHFDQYIVSPLMAQYVDLSTAPEGRHID